ncbi:hypothetical protein L535_2411 [Bordetella bronchiseptica SBL-F6116]|nr:hypothetical protein L535_2411 [Bordetella bronchiseptica SBL-F6116]
MGRFGHGGTQGGRARTARGYHSSAELLRNRGNFWCLSRRGQIPSWPSRRWRTAVCLSRRGQAHAVADISPHVGTGTPGIWGCQFSCGDRLEVCGCQSPCGDRHPGVRLPFSS